MQRCLPRLVLLVVQSLHESVDAADVSAGLAKTLVEGYTAYKTTINSRSAGLGAVITPYARRSALPGFPRVFPLSLTAELAAVLTTGIASVSAAGVATVFTRACRV